MTRVYSIAPGPSKPNFGGRAVSGVVRIDCCPKWTSSRMASAATSMATSVAILCRRVSTRADNGGEELVDVESDFAKELRQIVLAVFEAGGDVLRRRHIERVVADQRVVDEQVPVDGNRREQVMDLDLVERELAHHDAGVDLDLVIEDGVELEKLGHGESDKRRPARLLQPAQARPARVLGGGVDLLAQLAQLAEIA